MYTSHGHHIPNSFSDPEHRPDKVARCGGPGLCTVCSKEAQIWQNAKVLNDALKQKETTDMVETTKYVRKPFEVEAVQVTEENMEQIAEWCAGEILAEGSDAKPRTFIKIRVQRVLNERQTKAYPGDWVLYAGTGFKVYTPKAFKKTFELLDGEAKDNATQASKNQPTSVEELRTVNAEVTE